MRAPANTGKKPPLSPQDRARGQFIRRRRKTHAADPDHQIRNQSALYQECLKLQQKAGLDGPHSGGGPKSRKGVPFTLGKANIKDQTEHISEIEAGVRPTSPAQRRLLEQALAIPQFVLDGDHLGELGYWQASNLPPPTGVEVDSDGEDDADIAPLAGLWPLRDELPLARSRKGLFRRIDDSLKAEQGDGLNVVLLYGGVGIGKSRTLAEWWRETGRAAFGDHALALDCRNLQGDRIMRRIHGYVTGVAWTRVTPEFIGRVRSGPRRLVILDGLSDGSGYGGAAPTQADAYSLNKVMGLIRQFAKDSLPITLLLVVQTERSEQGTPMSMGLPAQVRQTAIQVKPLADDEGAALLRALGVDRVPTADLKRVSNALGGWPMALISAAVSLRSPDDVAREAFITQLRATSAMLNTFNEGYARVMSELLSAPFEDGGHPQAFMRLLALMPGPVTFDRLQQLMDQVGIRRLEGSRAAVLAYAARFVVFDNIRIDLHPFARVLMRRELAEIASGNVADAHTDREELQRIHRAAALIYDEALQSAQSNPSLVSVEAIEGALYHILALRDLLPEDPVEMVLAEPPHTLTEALAHGGALRQRLTQYCLTVLGERFLLERGRQFTLVRGQYETKARILSYFLDGHSLKAPARHLDLEHQRKLFSEAGVCWMHAGRLQLAQTAMQRATAISNASGTKADPLDEPGREAWCNLTETASNTALIMLRLGRAVDVVCDHIGPLHEQALRVAAAMEKGVKVPANVNQGARRVITRKAHIDLQVGDLSAALEGFDLAGRLAGGSDATALTGDAARRFVQASLRSRSGADAEAALDRARQTIRRNLEQTRSRRVASNDVIAYLTSMVAIERAAGDFGAAECWLSEAEQHEFVLFGECPYFAARELQLERLRLRLALDEDMNAIVSEAADLQRELIDAHHVPLAMEAKLLQAEASPARRIALVREVEDNLVQIGWHLRVRDVDLLRKGRSPVKELIW